MDVPPMAASEQDGNGGTPSPTVALARWQRILEMHTTKQGEALTQAMDKRVVIASAPCHKPLLAMHASKASLEALGKHPVSHLPSSPVKQEHHIMGLCKRGGCHSVSAPLFEHIYVPFLP